ncbi:hypothetical protein C8R43DRAFT_1242855 [Mycena crocata]|nr:hypothetical protein C8R43DRAFT_1242855 [Mycena crocata]
MAPAPPTLCTCGKPADKRCSVCRTVAYCSPKCQTRDWKAHKLQCKSAAAAADRSSSTAPPLQVASESQLAEFLRIISKRTLLRDSTAQGLDPSLIHGATGFDMYEEADSFWRLDADGRDPWEAKAQTHNREARQFWMNYLAPVTTSPVWVNVVLDTVLNERLPTDNRAMLHMGNATLLGSLFPHLSSFTPAQNTALLDIYARDIWLAPTPDVVRRGLLPAEILFAHGEPTADLIAQLVRRCLSPTRSYEEVEALLGHIAGPIQTYWPAVAGTRILDLALVIASPWRPGPYDMFGSRVPGDKIFEIAETSPAACKHLLHAVTRLCRDNLVTDPPYKLLGLFESFGVAFGGSDTDYSGDDDDDADDSEMDEGNDALAWFFTELPEDDKDASARFSQLLEDMDGGKFRQFGLVAKDDYLGELKKPTRVAMRRLQAL